MEIAAEKQRASGRPPAGAAVLQDAVTDKICAAVIEEISTEGFGRLSVEAVARRAGVGKAAVYRRWPSKEKMIEAVLFEHTLAFAAAHDTGSLRGDVRAYLEEAERTLTEPVYARLMPHVYAEVATNSALGATIREKVRAAKRAAAHEIVKRATARGEIAKSADAAFALDLLAGPIYWRMFIMREPVDGRYLESLCKAIVGALTASAPKASASKRARR
jgi:AcrR family transcriptional regulator